MTSPTPSPASPLAWPDVVDACRSLADGAFLATIQADGRPHLAWVGIGFRDDTMWTATYRSSQKAKNLRTCTAVALHWPERADRLIFGRAEARLIDDPDERHRLWDDQVLPYDQVEFFGSADNPELVYAELRPLQFSVHRGDPAVPPARWRRVGQV